jgi:uncharacterized protein YdhG (YjbR/CyaY superfamily)
MQSDAKTVDQYMDEVPEARREALTKLRGMCLEILEGYEENMEYGMPGYKREGKEIEVAFASQKQYISFYVLKKEVLDKQREALAGLNLGKGCIRYRKTAQIDFEIVEKLLRDSQESDSPVC